MVALSCITLTIFGIVCIQILICPMRSAIIQNPNYIQIHLFPIHFIAIRHLRLIAIVETIVMRLYRLYWRLRTLWSTVIQISCVILPQGPMSLLLDGAILLYSGFYVNILQKRVQRSSRRQLRQLFLEIGVHLILYYSKLIIYGTKISRLY